MSWTQADLDALDTAIATGASSVRYADGRETRFRSLADMTVVRNRVATALGAASSEPRAIILEHRR